VSGAIHPVIERILIPEEEIRARIKEIGAEIGRDYRGRDLIMVGILKGSIPFLAELIKAVPLDCAIDFVSISSYEGTRSTGVARLLLDLRENPEGKDVLLVEDIIDTGLTINYIVSNLKTRKPKSLEVCTLLDKQVPRRMPFKARYVGFPIPNEFVIGFGLDYNEKYRNLPYVGVMRQPALREGAPQPKTATV
jgi:hypoxanthine phosphoribosyltransferase